MDIQRLNKKRLMLCLLIAGIISMINVPSMADDSSLAIVGCATQSPKGYDAGFQASDFKFVNVTVDSNNQLVLNTGNQALDVNNIVVPFDQDVSVTFLYENGSYQLTRFGWMLAADVDSSGKPITSKIRWVYTNINDNDNNGVMDVNGSNSANRWGDRNGDGVVDARDNKELLGTFQGGTELVFVLDSSPNNGNANNGSYWGSSENRGGLFYTKKAWNEPATQKTYPTPDNPTLSNLGGIQRLVQFYTDSSQQDPAVGCEQYDRNGTDSGRCTTGCGPNTHVQGWLDAPARTRLRSLFGLNFDAAVSGNTKCIDDPYGTPSQHFIVAAPAQNQNAWILGVDDQIHSARPSPLIGGNSDNDYNDMVFLIERKTGGTAALQPDILVNGQLVGNAIKPDDSAAFFTSVTMEVFDDMPCAGKSNITYSISPDNGATWIDVTSWDEVRVSNASQIKTGSIVSNWTPGNPEITYRKVLIDFSASGKIGREFLWKAQMTSDVESCVPKIINVNFNFTVAKHGVFARSAPVTQVNMLYAGSYETPDVDWTDYYLRGHLTATRLYDPNDPTKSDVQKIWDAGERLNLMNIAARKIYFPRTDTISVPAYQIAKGDGATKTFTYTILNTPIQDTSVLVTDGAEKFNDVNDQMVGDYGGTGTIDRFTGQITVNFAFAPYANQPITLAYTYYKTYAAMKEFKPNNLTVDDLGLTSDWYYTSTGKVYTYDFDNSCRGADNCVVDQNDANWLINWIRGYKDGRSTPKSWLLGPIDHSTPAIDVAPGKTSWYFGSAVSDADRAVYDQFMADYKDKRATAYVGSRDGMLHAFDAGLFRWGDNPKTTVKEVVGYFEWTGDTSDTADYGTGDELWAFIPINLMSRLKNNYLGKGEEAYVDASPTVADVFINNYGTEKWTSILMSAEGNGGNTVFCLDVTTPGSPQFLWEYSHPDLIQSKSSPSVAKIGKIKVGGQSAWAAFFVSGKKNTTQDPSIYVIDIGSGNLLMRISLSDPAIGTAGMGGVPSGQPAIIDYDGDGYIDRLYIGTDKGYLYKVNIPGDGTVSTCVLNIADSHQPIYGTPAVLVDRGFDSEGNVQSTVLIYYGTGDSPYASNDMSSSTIYSFYAYQDTDLNGVCTPIKTGPLWKYDLPAGEKVWTSAFAAAGRIYFGTTTNDTEDPCSGGGKSTGAHLYVFDQKTADPSTPLQSIATPNLSIPPLVDDGHLYIRDAGGNISSYGGAFNQPKIPNVQTQMRVKSWREIY